MREVNLIFFEPGQKAEHEGVTYIAELQAKGGLCMLRLRARSTSAASRASALGAGCA